MSTYKVVLQGPQGQQEAFFKSFKQAMLFYILCWFRAPFAAHRIKLEKVQKKLEKVQKEIKLPIFL
tara:strand:+ start:3394 stop:3591 length:198 start_codon:yes stop_codon:yes gene_type:complete